MRKRNTNKNGKAWTQNEIEQVWQKGLHIPDYSSDLWCLDKCGTLIKFTDFGNPDSQYGWEIDHIIAVSNGGNDTIENLQPLNHVNNIKKEDQQLWSCPVLNKI